MIVANRNLAPAVRSHVCLVLENAVNTALTPRATLRGRDAIRVEFFGDRPRTKTINEQFKDPADDLNIFGTAKNQPLALGRDRPTTRPGWQLPADRA